MLVELYQQEGHYYFAAYYVFKLNELNPFISCHLSRNAPDIINNSQKAAHELKEPVEFINALKNAIYDQVLLTLDEVNLLQQQFNTHPAFLYFLATHTSIDITKQQELILLSANLNHCRAYLLSHTLGAEITEQEKWIQLQGDVDYLYYKSTLLYNPDDSSRYLHLAALQHHFQALCDLAEQIEILNMDTLNQSARFHRLAYEHHPYYDITHYFDSLNQKIGLINVADNHDRLHKIAEYHFYMSQGDYDNAALAILLNTDLELRHLIPDIEEAKFNEYRLHQMQQLGLALLSCEKHQYEGWANPHGENLINTWCHELFFIFHQHALNAQEFFPAKFLYYFSQKYECIQKWKVQEMSGDYQINQFISCFIADILNIKHETNPCNRFIPIIINKLHLLISSAILDEVNFPELLLIDLTKMIYLLLDVPQENLITLSIKQVILLLPHCNHNTPYELGTGQILLTRVRAQQKSSIFNLANTLKRHGIGDSQSLPTAKRARTGEEENTANTSQESISANQSLAFKFN